MEIFNIHRSRENNVKNHHIPNHLASPMGRSWKNSFHLLFPPSPPLPTQRKSHIKSFQVAALKDKGSFVNMTTIPLPHIPASVFSHGSVYSLEGYEVCWESYKQPELSFKSCVYITGGKDP